VALALAVLQSIIKRRESVRKKHDEMEVEKREKMRDGKGVVTIRHLFKKDEFNAKVRFCARLTLPPGASIGMHQHVKEDELFVFLRGNGVIDDGKKSVSVEPGDAVVTGNGESHSLINNGKEDIEAIAVIMTY
jgi:mannose-6-phosphate isomerase-like protein (cupin superfamily)